ncbi:MAG: hypothetical protein ACE5RK_00885 [Candidatus Nitrosomaritimum aestuariumsis]|uniref:Uncharacterized protein n=1 Tax=Candidatus Nitrosomaritimum aestuariumsis TaxID=3342354 RepID=A0AC60VXV5_9ARCH|nr:hypothetical protein [Nitrosopumilaceae archaeon]NCF22246.1 hypothetical protein [Nitrosopumilaceae archaeon]
MDKKIPLINELPKIIPCTNCNLPMQYQKKSNEKFLWQCFKCGKKYFVSEKLGDYLVEETWSPPK